MKKSDFCSTKRLCFVFFSFLTFRLFLAKIINLLCSHCLFAAVSYIPEKAVVRLGENVTVYCVFNTHNINASAAMWILNFEHRLDHSQYHPVSQWVSWN